MDRRVLQKLDSCEQLMNMLKNYSNETNDDIHFCVGGEILEAYLKSSEQAERKINNIERELQKLRDIMLHMPDM